MQEPLIARSDVNLGGGCDTLWRTYRKQKGSRKVEREGTGG